MDNEKVENPSTNVESGTALPNPQPKVEFTPEQQEKINSLIKQERDRVLTKLGVNSVEEGRSKLDTYKDYDELKAKASEYDKLLTEKVELMGTNAMLSVGIADDMKDIVKSYFKGSGKELTTENLNKLFEEKPKLKEQWVGGTNNIPKVEVNVGNNRETKAKETDDMYAEFRKYTKY